MECSTPVRRPGVVIIKTLALLVFRSRPSDARYIQTLIRLLMRTNLRLKDVNRRVLSITVGQLKGPRKPAKLVRRNNDLLETGVVHDHFLCEGRVASLLLQCRYQPHHIVYIALALGPGTPFGEVHLVADGSVSVGDCLQIGNELFAGGHQGDFVVQSE